MQLIVCDAESALFPNSELNRIIIERAALDVGVKQPVPDEWCDILPFIRELAGKKKKIGLEADFVQRLLLHLRQMLMISPELAGLDSELLRHLNRIDNKKDSIVAFVSAGPAAITTLKLRLLGIELPSPVHASADDGHSLDQILYCMQTRLKRAYGIKFTKVQFIGADYWSPAATLAGYQIAEFPMTGASLETSQALLTA